LGQNSGFYKKNFAESKKEFCLLMPVGRFFLKRKTRADARSVLVSKKLSLGGGGGGSRSHSIREIARSLLCFFLSKKEGEMGAVVR
jgi:hypothetical protein